MLQRRLQRPLLDDSFYLPKETEIDGRLVVGATLFVVGWKYRGESAG
jgi:hypothetical protein